jgi:CubicO group peptidase (beta-lactamase class C family)
VDPENWQVYPDHQWAFWHAGELQPKRVPRAEVARALDVALEPMDVGALEVDRVDGTSSRVSSILTDTYTDACVVLQDGAVVFEDYGRHGEPKRPHALMSVSKSIVGCVAAVLVERGDLDPERLLTDYVPELQDSGYRGATARHVLDMRSGVHFSEEYANPVAEIREMDRWIGWSQRTGGQGTARALPVPPDPAGRRPPRWRVSLSVGRDRCPRVGVRTCLGHRDGALVGLVGLAADGSRARRRPHL